MMKSSDSHTLISFHNLTLLIRLSFVTEQVAAHTNGTIGALLNATFGNAPELLLSAAALRFGFYRVIQLAMLGSMLTNLLFVFGVSCLVGGLRWQVQELRITSGNVSVGMLLVATAGSLLPAALAMTGQMRDNQANENGAPSFSELQFCRINAALMMVMYVLYLLFQLGTHKEEFDEDENVVETPEHLLLMTPHFTSRHGRKKRADRNRFCLKWLFRRDEEQPQYQSIELTRARKGHSPDEAFNLVADNSSLSGSSSDSKESGTDTGLDHYDSSSLPGRTSRRRNRRRRQQIARTHSADDLDAVEEANQKMQIIQEMAPDGVMKGTVAQVENEEDDDDGDRDERKCSSMLSRILQGSHVSDSAHVVPSWFGLVVHHHTLYIGNERHLGGHD